ncbi:MAG TPA: hypothetical protein PK854_02995 [Oscillospiraceae bacterium]|nr:hypothetical protein [Oscillospiraceae bacterium]HPS34212.1 hypothetical protein [Oscillospiraceae bacterium]
MPWGTFPLIGIALGLICGFLQYRLLAKLVSVTKEGTKPGKLLLLFFFKLGLYALFLVPAVLLSVPDGIACGGLAGLTLVATGVINALRKRGEGK